MMEKTGEIRPGVTPPEDDPQEGEKAASGTQLESHTTTRAADVAKSCFDQQKKK
jgi:hypothetical protein